MEERQLEQREARWDEEPNGRERTLALASRRAGSDEAERMTQRWLERDRMDPEALVALADMASAARRWATCSGPRAGSRARSTPTTGRALCRRAWPTSMRLAARPPGVRAPPGAGARGPQRRDGAGRRGALRRLARPRARRAGRGHPYQRSQRALDRDETPPRLAGPFKLEATWGRGDDGDGGGEADLDLVVVSPSGRVVSRLGGAVGSGTTLVAEDVTATAREELTFKGSENGRWQVFVVRRADHVAADAPERIEGTVRITAHGATRRISFVVGAEAIAAPVADIEVEAR